MKHVIILDTNILRKDFLLKSNHFRILKEFMYASRSKLVLPSIVFQELIQLYKKEIEFKHNELSKLTEYVNRNLLVSEVPDYKTKYKLDIDKSVSEYKHYIKKQLNPFVEEIYYENSFLPELVRRSVEKVKPISSKGEEFRDALLWLTILNYVKKQKSKIEVSFITNNITDFGDKTKRNLHPDLLEEIKTINISFHFYTSLSDFIQKSAVTIANVNKQWLKQNLDWKLIQESAEQVVNGIDPSFFYEYYYGNKIDKSALDGWDIIYTHFYEEVNEFHIYRNDKENTYTVEVFLNGNVELEFENTKNQFFQRDVDFYTSVYLTLKEMEIVDFSTSRFGGEESGLDFGPTYESTREPDKINIW